mmetsp:Transcript_54162/g.97588  ORF Transcript_54162/g.97588 Transcript_54162/m.97588 type:complete len:105 (-) Transcript_54162:665-979(-)
MAAAMVKTAPAAEAVGRSEVIGDQAAAGVARAIDIQEVEVALEARVETLPTETDTSAISERRIARGEMPLVLWCLPIGGMGQTEAELQELPQGKRGRRGQKRKA